MILIIYQSRGWQFSENYQIKKIVSQNGAAGKTAGKGAKKIGLFPIKMQNVSRPAIEKDF